MVGEKIIFCNRKDSNIREMLVLSGICLTESGVQGILKWIYQSSRIPPTRFATKFALLPMFPTKENVHLDGVAPKVSKAFLLLSTLYTLAHSVRKPTTIIHHASEKIVENEEKSLYFQRRATPRWNRYFSRRAIFFSKQNRQGYCFIQKI